MKTFTIKGSAINLYIQAESKEAAKKIFFGPLTEVAAELPRVWFEKKEV